jgi:3-oxoacyl-[acyl-carrier protein] reductase
MSEIDPAPAAESVDATEGRSGEAIAFGCVETQLTHAKEKGGTVHRGRAEIAVGIPTERLDSATSLIRLGRPGILKEATGAMFCLVPPLLHYVCGSAL